MNVIKAIDELCDSKGDYNDVPFEHLDFPNKEIIATRIIAEIQSKFNQKLSHTSAEPYIAEDIYSKLKQRINQIDSSFNKYFGSPDLKKKKGVEAIVKYALSMAQPVGILFLKEGKARDILIEHPPLKLMEHLRYKTINELFDNEDIYEMYCVLRTSEKKEWFNKFLELMQYVGVNDFEQRDINIKILNPDKYPSLIPILQKKQPLWDERVMGCVFGIPFSKLDGCPVPTIRTLTRAYHYFTELSYHSKFIDIVSEASFGDRLKTVLNGQYQKHNFFEPHALLENLYWSKTCEFLFKDQNNISELDFWMDGLDVGGFLKSKGDMQIIISFNILDSITNTSKRKEFPGNTRMLAGVIKRKVFDQYFGDTEIKLLENMDRGYIEL